jgi:aquaporin Z
MGTDATAPGAAQPERPLTPPVWRRLSAEAIGTFALVTVAVGGDAFASLAPGEISAAARAVAPALIVLALIYSIGDASGAHFNPVVTLAFALRGLFPWRLVVAYWSAQLIGAAVGALVVRSLVGPGMARGVSMPHLVEPTVAVAIEAVLTLLLVTVILGTADRSRIVGTEAALAVGATIALAGLIALPIEGASMNPARSIGPAVVTGDLANTWIYVVGPTIGSVLAVAITWLLHGPPPPDPKALQTAQGDGSSA